MDTTETYIKMRLAAIPDMGRGDTTLTGNITQMFSDDALMDEYGNYYAGYRSMCFKLERQDQLQEMIGDPLNELIYCLWDAFAEWDGDGSIFSTPKWALKLTSMEQLWLALVMKEKYNKTWDGEKWYA